MSIEQCVYQPGSGGVRLTDSAVNSASKYLTSVSDVTWGLKGGVICKQIGNSVVQLLLTLQILASIECKNTFSPGGPWTACVACRCDLWMMQIET